MITRLRTIDRLFILLFAAASLSAILVFAFLGKSVPAERTPMIAYLGDPLASPEVWLVSTDGSSQTQLTHTGGKVFDFTVSPGGENLVYSVSNNNGGADLFLIDREGLNAKPLTDCEDPHCTQPVWSSDGRYIAYSQYTRALEEDGRIRLIDVKTGTPLEYRDGMPLSGAYPVFSPDGRYLAYINFTDGTIHLFDWTVGEDRQAAPGNPEVPAWSLDGSELYFTATIMNGILPQSRLFWLDLANMQVSPFLEAETAGYDASRIEWSPDGAWGVFGMKASDSQSGRQIYIVRKDSTNLQAVTNDAGTSHAAYHWSPNGGQIVFQRYMPGMIDAAPQIVLWDKKTGSTTVLSENGALPIWLP